MKHPPEGDPNKRSDLLADIILIDDDEVVRAVVRRMLERKGYQVREAADGKSGMDLYRQKPADLIITDILMHDRQDHINPVVVSNEKSWQSPARPCRIQR